MTDDVPRDGLKADVGPAGEPAQPGAGQAGGGMTDPGDGEPSPSARMVKRFFIALIGGTVVLIGIAMIVLPGPALIVIPAGLAILATEFIWARRALKKCKAIAKQTQRRVRKWWPLRKDKPPEPPAKSL